MTKNEIIAGIKCLPESIIDKAYHIDVINRKAILQHDEFIEADLRQFFGTNDEDFLFFDCFGWRIVMERNE